MRELIGLSIIIAFFWSLSAILTKHLSLNLPAPILMFASSVLYASVTATYAWFAVRKNRKLHWDDVRWTRKSVIAIVLLVVFGTFLPNILFLRLIKNHDASIVTALTYVSPIFTVVLGYLLFRERVSKWSIGGILLIVVGVMMVAMHQVETEQNA